MLREPQLLDFDDFARLLHHEGECNERFITHRPGAPQSGFASLLAHHYEQSTAQPDGAAVCADPQVKVMVFDSAVPDFFLTHYDFVPPLSDTTNLPPGPTGLPPVPDLLIRLSRVPAVSIVSIRGRATGVGSELALASDMRFASREHAILSQWEVGAALVPGGGPMARLPRLIGRGRALEVLLGADDIPGDLAELYGYVNRSLPDNQLDEFVDALARRIASFDKQGTAETKRLVDVASLPPDAEIKPEWDAFIASLGRPASQKRIKALMERGFHRAGDVENRLGFHVGQLMV